MVSFVGRQAELTALDDVLKRVTRDGARVMRITGPAGIGKTALLRRFRARHRELHVLWADGPGASRRTPFTVVGELLGAGLRARQPPLRPDDALPTEAPIGLGRRIVPLLRGLARHRPVGIVLDDAHRADPGSLRALRYALRELSAHPLLTVVVTPSEEAAPPPELDRLADPTAAELVLGPLGPAEIQAMAAAAGVPDLPLHTACRLCTHTRGNPRHALALLTERSLDWSGPDHHALPAPRLCYHDVGRRLDGCGTDARRLVAAVALLGEPAVLSSAAAQAGLDDPWPALDAACAAGLLAIPDPSRAWLLGFPDPLVRAAVGERLRLAPAIW